MDGKHDRGVTSLDCIKPNLFLEQELFIIFKLV